MKSFALVAVALLIFGCLGGQSGQPTAATGAGGVAGVGATGGVGGAGATGGVGGAGAGSGGMGTGGVGGAGAGAGAGGTAGAGAGAGAGGGGGMDQCAADADCAVACLVPPCPQGICQLNGNGYRVCVPRVDYEGASCESQGPEECCESADDCSAEPGGHCVPFSIGYCGGPAPPDYSTCRYDNCDSDDDCTEGEHGVCLGDLPRTCFYGPCRSSADCTEGSDGRCVSGMAGQPCPTLVVYCQYSDDPCASSADCSSAGGLPEVCEPDDDGHGRHCEPNTPPPP